MLFLEGAINKNSLGGTTFTRIKAPSHDDMVSLVHAISQRIARYLDRPCENYFTAVENTLLCR
jgi:hypothetical protein